MPVRLVLFDIAGTTVEDPDGVGGCLKAALDAAEVAWTADEVNAIMGIPKPVAIEVLMKSAGFDPDSATIEAIHRDFQARMIEYYRTSPVVREVPGAAATFRILRESGVKVGLDTGFDRSIVEVLLSRLGWGEDVIDVSVTSDEVERGRPYPDLVFEAMRRAGVGDAAEVVKVGDTPSDLQEGTAAGCGMVVGVTQGTHTAEQLRGHPHTHLVESVRDVPGLLV